MSSPNPRVRVRGLVAALVLPLVLTACFRPLYGPTPSGERLQDVLAAVRVEPVQAGAAERFAHYLRQEVAFALDGSGQPRDKRYRLTLVASQTLQTPIVDSVAGRATSASIVESVTYTLTAIDTGRVVTTGVATGSASYDRFTQRFATVRAARDAEIRAAKVLADQIRTRLAAAIAASA